jgi:prevent-host-death family protein
MMKTTTSQEFNRQASALRHRATEEPLLITDRGRPAHVLISYAAYQALQGPAQSVADELDEVLQTSRDWAGSADLT